mgnify:CR=1 FL=1
MDIKLVNLLKKVSNCNCSWVLYSMLKEPDCNALKIYHEFVIYSVTYLLKILFYIWCHELKLVQHLMQGIFMYKEKYVHLRLPTVLTYSYKFLGYVLTFILM